MEDITIRILSIKEKLQKLKAATLELAALTKDSDPNQKQHDNLYQTFPVQETELLELEKELEITLPVEYREFLKQVGYGPGPGYGLLSPGAAKERNQMLLDSMSYYVDQADDGGWYEEKDFNIGKGYERITYFHQLKEEHVELYRYLLGAPLPKYLKPHEKSMFYMDISPRVLSLEGALIIANHGHLIFDVLVLSGEMAGTIWQVDKDNGQSLTVVPYGFKEKGSSNSGAEKAFTFLPYMENWIDSKIEELITKINKIKNFTTSDNAQELSEVQNQFGIQTLDQTKNQNVENDPMEYSTGTLEQRKRLKDIYGFEFPEDFWDFCRFLEEIKGTETQKIFQVVDDWGFLPTGPIAVLNGELEGKETQLPIIHHMRFGMDPPEFYTVLLGRDDGLHYGYWVDDTRGCDICVAGYYTSDSFKIDFYGKSLIEVIRYLLEDTESAYAVDLESENKDEIHAAKNMLRKLSRLRNVLMKYGTGDREQKGEEYCTCYELEDNRPFTAPTWEGMGIVVPENTYEFWDEEYFEGSKRPDKGYSPEKIKELCQRAEEFVERGLYGNALQIGKNLWSFGMKYSEEATLILEKAYKGLGRDNYAELIREHQLHRGRNYADITIL